MTAQITSAQADRPGRRMAVSLSALAGIGYAAAWIISVSVGGPNPSVAASGSQVVVRPTFGAGCGVTALRSGWVRLSSRNVLSSTA